MSFGIAHVLKLHHDDAQQVASMMAYTKSPSAHD